MGFFSRRKAGDLPKAPSLKKAAQGAKKEALSQVRTAAIRAVVTDRINQKQFAGYSTAKLVGASMPDAIQQRLDRVREASDLANTFALRSGASRVEMHDAHLGGANAAYKKLETREEKRFNKRMGKATGVSLKEGAKMRREELKKYDKKYPNSVDKWMD
jgi:hypothetical protein